MPGRSTKDGKDEFSVNSLPVTCLQRHMVDFVSNGISMDYDFSPYLRTTVSRWGKKIYPKVGSHSSPVSHFHSDEDKLSDLQCLCKPTYKFIKKYLSLIYTTSTLFLFTIWQ